MSKLGYIICKAHEGFEVLAKSDVRCEKYARDASECLQALKGITGQEPEMAEYLRFGESEALIDIVRPARGRWGDFKSVTIVVPSSADVSGKRLGELVRQVADELSKPELDKGKIADIVTSGDYDQKELPAHPSASPVSHDSKYAFRETSTYAKHEILDNLFQQYYYDYKAIFLIDKLSQPAPSDVDNLTEKDLVTEVVLRAPKDLAPSVSVLVKGKPFVGETFFSKGDRVSVVYKKGICESQTMSLTLNETVNYIESGRDFIWQVRVSRSKFVICDELTQKELPNARVFVEGIEVNGLVPPFKESDLRSASLKVTCDGYEAGLVKNVNLLGGGTINCCLTKLPVKREYEIVSTNPKLDRPVRFSVDDVKALADDESPIQGYKVCSPGKGRVSLELDNGGRPNGAKARSVSKESASLEHDNGELPVLDHWRRSSLRAKIVAIVVALFAIVGVALSVQKAYVAVQPYLPEFLGGGKPASSVVTHPANEEKKSAPAPAPAPKKETAPADSSAAAKEEPRADAADAVPAADSKADDSKATKDSKTKADGGDNSKPYKSSATDDAAKAKK